MSGYVLAYLDLGNLSYGATHCPRGSVNIDDFSGLGTAGLQKSEIRRHPVIVVNFMSFLLNSHFHFLKIALKGPTVRVQKSNSFAQNCENVEPKSAYTCMLFELLVTVLFQRVSLQVDRR